MDIISVTINAFLSLSLSLSVKYQTMRYSYLEHHNQVQEGGECGASLCVNLIVFARRGVEGAVDDRSKTKKRHNAVICLYIH